MWHLKLALSVIAYVLVRVMVSAVFEHAYIQGCTCAKTSELNANQRHVHASDATRTVVWVHDPGQSAVPRVAVENKRHARTETAQSFCAL